MNWCREKKVHKEEASISKDKKCKNIQSLSNSFIL